MLFRFSDSAFYLTSGSAQVWSALMVFHILLIRDLKHHVEREIDNLWSEARILWPRLLISLKSPEGLKSKLGQFGLSTDTILRADTHKNSFIRLIAAIKTHKIISEHLKADETLEELELTPAEWQLKFEPIAERIQELEAEKPETHGAFLIGLIGVAVNWIFCATGSLSELIYSSALVIISLCVNLILLYLFAHQVRQALNHFNVTAQHDAIADQIDELEEARGRNRRNRRFRQLQRR